MFGTVQKIGGDTLACISFSCHFLSWPLKKHPLNILPQKRKDGGGVTGGRGRGMAKRRKKKRVMVWAEKINTNISPDFLFSSSGTVSRWAPSFWCFFILPVKQEVQFIFFFFFLSFRCLVYGSIEFNYRSPPDSKWDFFIKNNGKAWFY